jgi:hypothetical protein
MRCFAKLLFAMLLLGCCTSLLAQQLSDAQRSAIKSACRSDYQTVCANVPPGTKDSLQCLVQHNQQVSAPCQEALAPAAASGTAASSSGASGAPATAAAAAPQ